MNETLAWSDYSTVLLIAEEGTLSAAARASGDSHPTLMRRLNAIEARIGARLFERFRQGYAPTPAGTQVIEAARDMRDLAAATERRLAGHDMRPAGRVVLTTTDTVFRGLVAPALAAFAAACPGIELDIRLSNAVQDLSRRDADIALRPATDPPGYLKGRMLGTIRQALHAAPALSGVATDALPVIGPSPAMPYDTLAAYMRETGLDRRCRLRLDSVRAMHDAALAGAGAAILPLYLCDAGGLELRGPAIPALDTPLWLLVHPDLQHTARVRAVLDALAGTAGIRERLAG